MTDPIATARAAYDVALEHIEAGRRMIEEGKAARDRAAGALCLDLDLSHEEVRRLLRVGTDQVERMVQSALWMRAAEAERLLVENTPSKVTCLRCLTVILATDIEDHDRLHGAGAGGDPTRQ